VDDLLSLCPPGSARDADGMLVLGGCRADALAAEFGTPVLVVDEGALRARAREYADGLAARWPRSRVVFASKAFPCTAVQRVMVGEGLGLDVAGGGEIVTALKAGVDPALVVLHGNAKSDEEIAMACEHGLGLVAVDNADDVDRLEATVSAGRAQDVLVRVIPGVTADTHAHVLTGHEGSKFGLAPAAAAELIRRIEASPRLRMRGVHVHVGSQILDVEPFAASVAPVAALGEFEVYDLGGGLGVPYLPGDELPDPVEWVTGVVAAAHAELGGSKSLVLEPGRALVANAGVTLYRVESVKPGAAGERVVAVDGGMSDNLRPMLYGAAYDAALADRIGAGGSACTVVGKHCESGDVLVRRAQLPEAREGDVLVTPVTGAYGHAMASNYNGVRRPPIVFCAGGAARAVVRRETYEELGARDV
jgi:diaminopimelate decarboxylase